MDFIEVSISTFIYMLRQWENDEYSPRKVYLTREADRWIVGDNRNDEFIINKFDTKDGAMKYLEGQ